MGKGERSRLRALNGGRNAGAADEQRHEVVVGGLQDARQPILGRVGAGVLRIGSLGLLAHSLALSPGSYVWQHPRQRRTLRIGGRGFLARPLAGLPPCRRRSRNLSWAWHAGCIHAATPIGTPIKRRLRPGWRPGGVGSLGLQRVFRLQVATRLCLSCCPFRRILSSCLLCCRHCLLHRPCLLHLGSLHPRRLGIRLRLRLRGGACNLARVDPLAHHAAARGEMGKHQSPCRIAEERGCEANEPAQEEYKSEV